MVLLHSVLDLADGKTALALPHWWLLACVAAECLPRCSKCLLSHLLVSNLHDVLNCRVAMNNEVREVHNGGA